MLQRDRLPHAAAPHDDARLSVVDKEADVVEHEVIAKRFADVAEFDEVARRGRLVLLKDARAHAGPLLLMSPRAEANVLVAQASACRVLTASVATLKTRQAEARRYLNPLWKFRLDIRVSN